MEAVRGQKSALRASVRRQMVETKALAEITAYIYRWAQAQMFRSLAFYVSGAKFDFTQQGHSKRPSF